MNLETTEEKIVWALAYAAAETSTTWHERRHYGLDEHVMSQRADAAVVQFRRRCAPAPVENTDG